MFGRKPRLAKLKESARSDYLKCASLTGFNQLEKLFIARIGERSRLNLDKIFVQGAQDEEKHQQALINAFKSNQADVIKKKSDHDGFNSLKGMSGTIISWVPEVYANQMYSLGRDYQILAKNTFEVLEVADEIARKVEYDLQLTKQLVLLKLIRDQEGP
jgi:hypothetical protein